MQNTAAEEESLKSFRNPENQSSQSICNLMRDNSLLRKEILYYGHDDLRSSRRAPLERRSKQKTAGRTGGGVHHFGFVVHHPILETMKMRKLVGDRLCCARPRSSINYKPQLCLPLPDQ